jgi:hypothetical protein
MPTLFGIAGPVEVDNHLVVRSRFIVDSREGVLSQTPNVTANFR